VFCGLHGDKGMQRCRSIQEIEAITLGMRQPAAWMIGMIVTHWMLDPILRDHYFETFLFLIGLFSTLTLDSQQKHG